MDALLTAEMESLLDTYKLAMEYGPEDARDKDFYLRQMSSLCKTHQDAKQSERALSMAKEKHTVEDFNNVYNEAFNKRQKSELNITEMMQCFENRLKEISDEAVVYGMDAETSTNRVECDEFVMESEINVYDPLTKVRMQDPVVNKLCGHHYEKSAILQSIVINPRLRCPVAGCGNTRYITKENLAPDTNFKIRLQKMAESEN